MRLRTGLGKRLAALSLMLVCCSPKTSLAIGEILYVLNQGEDLLLVLDPQTLDIEASILLSGVGGNFVAIPNGRRLYAPDDVGLAVIDTSTNAIIGRIDLEIDQGARSGDGSGAGVGSFSRSSIGVTPDGAFVYALSTAPGASKGQLSVISTGLDTVIDAVETLFFPTGTAVTPDGANVLAPIQQMTVMQRISTATNEVVETIDLGSGSDPSSNIAFSPDGSLAYVCTRAGIQALDTESFARVSELPVEDGCSGLAVRTDGRIYAGRGTNDLVAVVDPKENEIVDEVSVPPHPRGLALSLNGSRLYVTSTESDMLTVIDTASNEVLMTEEVGSEPNGILVVDVPPPLPTVTLTASPAPTTPPISSGGGCSAVAGDGETPWTTLFILLVAAVSLRRPRHHPS